jgi:hypothetical protein
MRYAVAALIAVLTGTGEGRAADFEAARPRLPIHGLTPYGPPSPDMQRPLLQLADPVDHWPSQPRERDARYYAFSFAYSMLEGYARQRNDVDLLTGRRRDR